MLSDLQKQYLEFEQKQQFDYQPTSLYDPVRYIMSLGGKRIRPLLVLASYQYFGKDVEAVLSAAYAIELFHNFTLVHDDIMDEADTRRGKPTVHLKYDTNTAILSGDVMQIMAIEYLMAVPSDNSTAMVKLFLETSRRICDGQQMDMEFEKQTVVEVADYLEMIKLKTAILLGASLQIGAALGGANTVEQKHFYNIGIHAGIAFQLRDDYLDAFGDERFGKQIGGDIIQGKKTYLVLKTFEKANPEDTELLNSYLTNNEMDVNEKVEKVKDLFLKYDIPTEIANLQKEYESKVDASIKALGMKEDAPLCQIINGLRNRKS